MTQEALATKAGLTGRTLSAIETGNANPTWATVRDIAAALNISIADLAKLSEKHEQPATGRLEMRPKCDHDAPEPRGGRGNRI